MSQATLTQEERDMISSYIYDEYKSVYGVKPRWMDFDAMSDEELERTADDLEDQVIEQEKQRKIDEQIAIKKFKNLVAMTIGLGANDEETALRWLVQDEKFYHAQDVEHWLYNHGLLFTDYGKKMLDRLCDIVKFEEWEDND